MTTSAEILCYTEVEVDGLRMSNVKIAIWFGRKACHDFLTETVTEIVANNIAYKVTVFDVRG